MSKLVPIRDRQLKTPTGLTDRQFEGFLMYCEGKSEAEIGAMAGVTDRQIRNWKNSEWFKELHDKFLASRQNDVIARVGARADEVADGFMEVVTGVDKNDRTAGARVKGFEVFLSAGKNPVINKNPQVQINNNTQTNTVNVSIDDMNKMSEQELIDLHLTGEVPEHLKVINP